MTEMDHKRLLVFLSHASEDKKQVRNLCKRLRADGFDPWLDEERLLPGQDWNLEIEKALRASDAILLCFSALSVAKEGYIQREYKRAMKYLEEKPEGTIYVIPIRLDDCELPHFIREIQWVDYPTNYDRLVQALQIRAGGSSMPKMTTKPNKQVQIVLEGLFTEFNETRQQDLIAILAGILRIEIDSIRVLRVHSGSIVLVFEMPETAAYRLYELVILGDFRLKKAGLLSVQLDGEDLVSLPKRDSKPKGKEPARKRTSSQPAGNTVFNFHGNVNVQGAMIGGDQTNYYDNRQTFNITSPAQFVEELKKLREEIERLKSQPEVDKASALRMELAQAEIDSAVTEAEKDEPVAERIKDTLDGAKETMDKIGGSITSAVNLGTTLANLAMIAMKLFGG